MTSLVLIAAITAGAIVLGAGFLHLLPRLGRPGRAASAAFTRAPMLDLVVTYFTIAPLIAGPIAGGWWGLLAGVIGQLIGMHVWMLFHEIAHPAARRGPRIIKVLNRLVGPVRNFTAVWLTALVVPIFWLVRLAQLLVYPFLPRLIGFPRYVSGEWIAVSRQKFDGLVGHDLIWCLYCDWMTGVWALGTEMLRNVESFWCPIRFASDKKCANCTVDFPDLDGGWVSATASMEDVTRVLEEKHSGGHHGWFGHPTRLTVEGEDPRNETEGGSPTTSSGSA